MKTSEGISQPANDRKLEYIIKTENLKEEILAISKEIEEIIDIDNLINEIIKMTEKNYKGLITTLLFGAKRFGDWIQVYLSQKYYFMLQTTDYYNKLYAYLIGAPVIIDNQIYNYNHSDYLEEYMDNFKIFNKKAEISNINNEQLIYKSLRNIETPLSRTYFNKYIKYKLKYLKLSKKYNY